LLVLAVALAMVIQAPFLWEDTIAHAALYACWVLLFGVLILTTRIVVNRTLVWAGVCLLVFDAFCVLGQLLLARPYLSSTLFRAANLAMMLFIIGFLLSRRLSRDAMIPAALTYVVLAVVLVIYVYWRYFLTVTGPLDTLYNYSGKNSLGVIAVSAAIILLSLARYVRSYRAPAYVVSAFFLWSVFLLQNRASLVALVVMLAWAIARQGRRAVIVALVIVAVLILLISQVPEAVGYLRSELVLGRLENEGLNGWSSGRVALAEAGWRTFLGSPLVGVGEFYVENFQLSALVQFGVVGAIPLAGLVLVTLGSSIIRAGRGDWISSAVPYLCLLMLVVSVFEELSPFGPGVRSLFSWLLVGYVSAGSLTDRQGLRDGVSGGSAAEGGGA
jgi:hypothetical protein